MNKPNPNATEPAPSDDADSRDELVARYLRGEMNASESEAFEIALLDDAELFAEVQFQTCLIEALAAEQAQAQAAAAAETELSTPVLSTLSAAQKRADRRASHTAVSTAAAPAPWWRYAQAAGLAFLAVGLLVQSVRLQQATSELAQLRQPSVLPADSISVERGTPVQDIVIEHAPDQWEVLLQIDSLDPIDLSLLNTASGRMSSFTGMKPDKSGYIRLKIPLEQPDSEYQLTITDLATGAMHHYRLMIKSS